MLLQSHHHTVLVVAPYDESVNIGCYLTFDNVQLQ